MMNARGLMGMVFSGALAVQAASFSALDFYPYAPAAGQTNTTALSLHDEAFAAWADGYAGLVYGTNVSEEWKVPAQALGAATGGATDIVCLGRGGQITLTFSGGIQNGDGADFAVFENGYSDAFLELAFVEVSSDGTNFVRFPNYSLSASPVGAFGAVDTTKVYGLAGKYRNGYGTPFDLDDLLLAYAAALEGNADFSAAFAAQLTNGVPLLDLERIGYVRIIDIVGDGTQAYDCRGWQIYDPYPTIGSAGFDLDAVGVLHPSDSAGRPQEIAFSAVAHQKLAFGSVALDATADSGLPVSFSIQSGPATVTNQLLYFSGPGTVEVVAAQAGNGEYAPAAPVLRTFRIAEEIQHIFMEQVPNRTVGSADVQLYAESSQGLPVSVEVYDAPENVLVNSNLVMELGDDAGVVVLRAFQPGSASVAPAEDVYLSFSLVEAGASNAPVALNEWFTSHPVPELSVAATNDRYGHAACRITYKRDLRIDARCRLLGSVDLLSWTNAVPELVGQDASGDQRTPCLQMPVSASNTFFRLQFDAL